MEIESIRVFTEVARQGSFSGAARSLKMPTTSVSYKINKLEESLKVQLLNRTTRTVELTEIGHEMYEKAMDLLATADDITNLADSKVAEAHGRLRISSPQAFGSHLLGSWLVDFQMAHPKVRIELLSSNLFLDMQRDKLDFTFRLGPLPDSSLIARKLFDVQFCTFASPAFLDRYPSIEHPDDLLKAPCITPAMEGGAINWRFQNHGENLQLQPDGIIIFEDIEWLIKAALEHAGVAYLPINMIDKELQSGNLVPVLQDWWGAPLTMYLVYVKEKHVPAKNRYFIEHIIEMCETLYK